jgi:hypothetical protein
VILARYDSRDRDEVHFDHDARQELEVSLRLTQVDPVPIDGETIEVDTTEFDSVDVDALIARVRGQL